MNGIEDPHGSGTALKRSDSRLVYDVGMHKGEDTELYLKRGLRVVGIEADPFLADYCRTKFAAEISKRQLNIVEGAITSQEAEASPSEVEFYRTPRRTVWGTVFPPRAQVNCELGFPSTIVKVKPLHLAKCFEAYGTPYYIKIDIEGAERDCLRQMLLCSGRPAYVSIESDQSSFSVVQEEFSLLSSLGYGGFKIVRQDIQEAPDASEAAIEGQQAVCGPPARNSGLFGDELPGRWLNVEKALTIHRLLTLRHFIVGERSSFLLARWVQTCLRRFPGRNTLMLNATSGWRRFMLRLLAPGWYDTHARYGKFGQ